MCLFFFIWFSLTQEEKKRLLSEVKQSEILQEA